MIYGRELEWMVAPGVTVWYFMKGDPEGKMFKDSFKDHNALDRFLIDYSDAVEVFKIA